MSLFNLDSISLDESASRVFSTARYLDSPLIADHLLSDIQLACTSEKVDPSVFHLRSLLNRAITEGRKTNPSTSWSNLQASWRGGSAYSNGHILPIAPSDLLTINATLTTQKEDPKIAETVMYAMQEASRAILDERGIASIGQVQLSSSTRHRFAIENEAVAAQSELVSLRAGGDTSIVSKSFQSKISDTIILSDAYVAFVQYDLGKILVGTYNMYLSLLDIVRSRARTLLGLDIMYSDSPLRKRVLRQWDWQEQWIYRYETEGFSIAKQTEALNKTRLGWITDEETRVGGAYEYMWSKIYDKIRKLEKSDRATRRIVTDARRTYEMYVDGAAEHELVELFGLQKAVGYPFIDSVRSGRAAAKEAQVFIDIEYEHALNLRNAWRSMFVAGYLAKEHKWPQMDFSSTGMSSTLYKWYSTNYTNLRAEDFILEEWNHVIFDKNFEFDYHENYLELMDDKALSYSREEADAYWNKSLACKSDRRLLLEIMSRDGFSFRAILEDIAEGTIHHNWKIVCIYPKEKELKPDARMFAMLVLEMRSFFNGCEANIADHIFPYISSQTMTKSKEDIHRIFHEFTKPRENSDNLHLFLECDLSRWNLRWRKRVVNLVGSDLNHLFGVQNAFTTAHEFFTSSIVVVRTPRLRPDGIEKRHPPAGPLVYLDWLGGLEGLQQKLWTLCTYAMIFIALVSLHVSYILLGQGDNQILSIVAPRDPYKTDLEQYRSLSERVTVLLEKHCAEVGQELKPDECLHSRTVITYSKEVWVSGVMYPLSLKYFSRIGARTNDEVPTICAELSGLHAASLAAAESNFCPLRVYFGCIFLHVREIEMRVHEKHPCWSNLSSEKRLMLKQLSVEDHMKILFWPSVLGGLSISTLVDYLHRGPADPLSQQLGLFFRACRSVPSVAPLYTLYLSESWLERPKDSTRLILVPHSLPLVTIPDARTQISQMIRAYIQTVAINPDFQRLMSDEQTVETETLLDDLMSMYPMYPLLAREIFDNSASAEVERIGKMYIMTQTIQKAARAAGVSVSGIINMASGDEFAARVHPLITCRATAPVLTIPLRQFEGEPARLRRRWEAVSAPLHGVSARASIWSDVTISQTPTRTSGVKAYGVISTQSITSIGPNTPYLGSRTKLTRSTYGYKLMGDSRSVTAITKLRTLANLPGTGPELQRTIQRVAETRGPIDGELTDLAGGVSSSRFDHRYHSRVDEQGSYPVGPYNFSTHVLFDTDTIDGISGSPADYPIKFQEYHTDALGCLLLAVSSEKGDPTFWELTLSLSDSDVDELPDLAVTLIETRLLTLPLNPIASALVYDPHVWRAELTGTVPRKGCSTGVDPRTLSTDTLISCALRSALTRHIPSHFTSTEVFDASLKIARPVSFDLAEMLRLGGQRILDTCAQVVAFAVFERFMVETQLGEGTGRIELYVRRYASFYANALKPLWDNPQTWNDPVAQTMNINAAHLIDGSSYTAHTRLRYLLIAQIRHYVYRRFDISNFTSLFESESGSTGSRVLVSILGMLHLSALRAGVPWLAIRISCSMPIVVTILRTSDEGTRLRHIARYAGILSRSTFWSTEARSILTDIAHGSLLSVIAMDDAVALRLSRRLQICPTRVAVCQNQSLTPLNVTTWTTNDKPEWTLTTINFLSSLSPRSGWILRLPMVDGSYSYYQWRLMFSRYTIENLLLIGVGHGYAARAFLDVREGKVIGVDRPLAYTLSSLRADRKPFALRNHARRANFSWSSSMYLFNPDTDLRHVFITSLSHAPDNTTVVFDIQPSLSIETLAEILHTQETCASVILRLFGSPLTIFESIRNVSRHLHIRDVYLLRCVNSVVAFILTSTVLTPPRLLPYWTYSMCYTRPTRQSLSTANTISESELQDTYDAITLTLDVDIRSAEKCADMLFSLRSLIGKVTISDKYIGWTVCLARIFVLQWLVEEHLSEVRLQALDCDKERYIRTNHGSKISIARSPQLVKMMTTTGTSLLFLRSLNRI